jgi:hypothetical protein
MAAALRRIAPSVRGACDEPLIEPAFLAASPWIFGFADESANVWVPHLVVGIAAVFLGLTTKQRGGYGYRKPTAVTG